MEQKLKRRLLQVLAVLVTAACVLWLVNHLGGRWDEVWEALREANYLYVVPSVFFIAVLYGFRVVRWRRFLKPICNVRHLSVASATCIGFMSSCVLPARAGEIIRPYVLCKKEDVGFGHALATALGLERFFDLAGLSILLLITWAALPGQLGPVPAASAVETHAQITAVAAEAAVEQPAPENGAANQPESKTQATLLKAWKYGLVLSGLAAAGLLFFLLLALFPGPLIRLAEACARPVPSPWRERITGFVVSVTESLGFMKSWQGVAVALVYSAGLWLAAGLSAYALSVGFGLRLGVAGGFLVTVFVALAVVLPQAPSFVGSFHVAAMLAAEIFQAPRSEAAAFALVLWLVNVVPITLVGLGFLWYEGLGLRQLAAESRRMATRSEDQDSEQ